MLYEIKIAKISVVVSFNCIIEVLIHAFKTKFKIQYSLRNSQNLQGKNEEWKNEQHFKKSCILVA
jgi:hypothetical protein